MEFGYTPSDLYAGYVVDDSDLEFSDCAEEESSDEDREEAGHSRCSMHGESNSEPEDEFEREMDKELMAKIQLMVSPNVARATNIVKTSQSVGNSKGDSSITPEASKPPIADAKKPKENYDDIYFDSSDSETEESQPTDGNIRNVGKKVCKLSNDELFYDPGLDAEDERWVNRQRMAYHNVKISRSLEKQKKQRGSWLSDDGGSDSPGEPSVNKGDNSKTDEGSQDKASLPKSDAVLNCPACMTTLCLDCQRHEQYVTQYRAMFVLNCLVVRGETLSYKPKPEKKRRKRRRGRAVENETEEPSTYHPVRCSECNTEVAVFDQDEVFHFFNVLASAPT